MDTLKKCERNIHKIKAWVVFWKEREKENSEGFMYKKLTALLSIILLASVRADELLTDFNCGRLSMLDVDDFKRDANWIVQCYKELLFDLL